MLPAEVLHQMKEPTAELRASTLGDAIGIGWFLRDVDGLRTVGHGGSANGQFAELLIVPERDFAVVALSNAGPMAFPSTRRSSAGRWSTTWDSSTATRSPSRLTRRAPGRSPGTTRTR